MPIRDRPKGKLLLERMYALSEYGDSTAIANYFDLRMLSCIQVSLPLPIIIIYIRPDRGDPRLGIGMCGKLP